LNEQFVGSNEVHGKLKSVGKKAVVVNRKVVSKTYAMRAEIRHDKP